VDRARLVGTAKESVILAMLMHDGFLSVKDIMAIANRQESSVSVPAVYRAIRLLEEKQFIVGLGSSEQEKVMENLRQLADLGVVMPGDRSVMLFRLTDTGRALGYLLKLAQGEGSVSIKDIQATANQVYAELAHEPVNAPTPVT
jgi:hypothetical protein